MNNILTFDQFVLTTLKKEKVGQVVQESNMQVEYSSEGASEDALYERAAIRVEPLSLDTLQMQLMSQLRDALCLSGYDLDELITAGKLISKNNYGGDSEIVQLNTGTERLYLVVPMEDVKLKILNNREGAIIAYAPKKFVKIFLDT